MHMDVSRLVPYNQYANVPATVAPPFASKRGATIEAIIGAWLHSKDQRSHSAKTEKAYRTIITEFRAMLQNQGYDLLWEDADFVTIIADTAQIYAAHRSPQSRRKGEVSPSTQNQRLAILSSFYLFAIKRGHLTTANPIGLVDRPHVEAYAQAQSIEQEDIQARLKTIDASTLQGARDLAILAVLLSTGRRVSEIAGLQRQHMQISGKVVKLSFLHMKGGKSGRNTLSPVVSRLLVQWLLNFYGQRFLGLPPETPLWVNVHHKSHYGEALGYHGIAGICLHYLGTSKVHTTRHTFATLMELAGAKLSEIKTALGHENAATTSDYLDKLKQDKNPYAEKLTLFLGLEDINV